MANIWKNIFVNGSTRVLALIFMFIIGITAFFLIRSYFSDVNHLEAKELAKLQAVANTLASRIDGDVHQGIMARHPGMNDIMMPSDDADYHRYQQLLADARDANGLGTQIYTLIYNREKKIMEFGLSSSDTAYFREPYKQFPPEILNNFDVGGTLGQYKSENGTWLSAYVPIKSSVGKTVALLEVDQNFDEFIALARKSAFTNLAISLGVILIIGFFFIRAVKTILKKEEELNLELRASKAEIEKKNKEVTASIRYAQRIQEAILPPVQRLEYAFPGSHVFFRPRDIVSGDFYWWAEYEGGYIVAVADCTGHGVPGAFMSMIGNTLLNEIVTKDQITEPAEILRRLNLAVQFVLKQENSKGSTRDGMDIAIVNLQKDMSSLTFAGANRPLVLLRGQEIIETRGTRRPIGGHNVKRKDFEQHELTLEKGDWIYLFSDGYPDQFGGTEGRKYMTKPFKRLLTKISANGADKNEVLDTTLVNWRSHEQLNKPFPQTDDILVMGIHIS